MSHPAGRRLHVLDDCDATVLAGAIARYGVLPPWTTAYTLDALLTEGYAAPADAHGPARLTAAGHARWERVTAVYVEQDRARVLALDPPDDDRSRP